MNYWPQLTASYDPQADKVKWYFVPSALDTITRSSIVDKYFVMEYDRIGLLLTLEIVNASKHIPLTGAIEVVDGQWLCLFSADYSADVDCLVIRFMGDSKIHHSNNITPNIIVDYDSHERILGFEFLGASHIIKQDPVRT